MVRTPSLTISSCNLLHLFHYNILDVHEHGSQLDQIFAKGTKNVVLDLKYAEIHP